VIRRVRASEWEAWRALRLRALQDTPSAFASTYEREVAYPEGEWRERTAALAGADDRALFVAEATGGGLVGSAAEHARAADTPFLRLYVVMDNEAARRLYLTTGFVDTGVTVPLPRDPGVLEYVMELRLT
jgi:hypothetical protein